MSRKRVLLLIISILLLFPVIFPLFTSYVPGTADGLAHKFRLISFDRALREGIIRPRWLADTALGYGSPIFLFNYLLPYYIVDFFYRLGFSVNHATQIFQALTLIFSFISMYLLAEKLWGRKAGLAAAAVYTYAPYHLSGVYIYEGWGEMTAFVFPPLIIYLVYMNLQNIIIGKHQIQSTKSQISTKSKAPNHKQQFFEYLNFGFILVRQLADGIWNFLLVLSWFLFILSHNVSAVMFTPIILGLGLVGSNRGDRGNKRDEGGLRKYSLVLSGFVTAVFLSAFFWLPAVLLNQQIAYPELIAKEAGMRFLYFKPLLGQVLTALSTIQKGNAGYYDFTLGLPILLIGIICLIRLIKQIRQIRITLETILLAVFFISLYLAAPSSNWVWSIVTPLKYIVYPYRFLFPATFAGSLLAGWLCSLSSRMTLPAFFILLAVISGYPFTHPYVDIFPFNDGYFKQPQTVFSAPATRKNMATTEFLPKSASLEFLGNVEERYFVSQKLPEKFILSPPAGKIIESDIGVEKMSLQAEITKPTTLTINTFFFPNWQARINGKFATVGMDEVGRMKVDLPKGKVNLELKFGVGLVEKIGYLLTGMGVILLVVELFFWIICYR